MPETDIDALTRASVPDDWTELDRRAVDTVRVLAADAVQKVGNGHPGTAMSLAPLAYTLFQRVMRHDPTDPDWIGRDRFVLSAGHSSLTLYIQLYLSGYGLELADLEALRTWGSKTPGHPEHRHTPGVEITTGPLGQGLASAVGMAMAARRERGLFDPDAALGESPFDHQIYVIASDGDIEEGVTSEASSLAGTQQLGNLTVIYDDNKISIEDDTTIALSEDTAKRYEAYGWHVQVVEGGENVTGILEALENAKAETDRPSFILLRTVIAFPAPKADEHRQGARLGARRREVAAVKEVLGFDPEQDLRGRRRGARPRPQGRRARRRRRTRSGPRCTSRGPPASPSARSCSTGCSAATCPSAGRRRCRRGSPTRRASPPARRPARCSRRWPTCCPSCGAARRTSPRATTPRWRARTRSARSRSPRRCGTPSPTAAPCTSASASTRWARSSTASPCTAPPAPTAAPSSRSATTCAAPSGWPR